MGPGSFRGPFFCNPLRNQSYSLARHQVSSVTQRGCSASAQRMFDALASNSIQQPFKAVGELHDELTSEAVISHIHDELSL